MSIRQNNEEIDKDYTIQQLRQEVYILQLQLKQQKKQNLYGGNKTLLKCEDIDLYPGEQQDLLISLLEQARLKCSEGSRSRDIIESLLSQNEKVGHGEIILNEVKRIFRSGVPTKQSDILDLERLGFKYIQSRKHPKLIFHNKYKYVLPGTTGDSGRSGKNSYADVSKCVALSIKI